MSDKIKQPVKHRVARVPVIMQLEELECGAACLCMILAYYNKWISLEKVREDCGVSRDGSNAGNMLRAARLYGLNADGYSAETEALKEKGHSRASFTGISIISWYCADFVETKPI